MRTRELEGLLVVLVILLSFGAYLGYNAPSQYTTSSESHSSVKGVITGFVVVGPSQPVRSTNQSCNVDLTGYSLEFTSECSSIFCQAQTYLAVLSPSGHYSIFLAAGQYSITGLVPSCEWIGCSSAFPQSVEVVGGSQIVFDINIDTGIR